MRFAFRRGSVVVPIAAHRFIVPAELERHLNRDGQAWAADVVTRFLTSDQAEKLDDVSEAALRYDPDLVRWTDNDELDPATRPGVAELLIAARARRRASWN
jgi:hypothetical protein